MNSKPKRILSVTLVVMLLLSMIMAFPAGVLAVTAELKILDPVDGDDLFHYTNNDPPPTAVDFPLGYVIASVNVSNVELLATWQVNITWDPELLRIANVAQNADMYVPTNNIFSPNQYDMTDPTITESSAFWVVSIKSPPDYVNGSGTLCQIKFNVTKVPTISENLTCNIHIIVFGEDLFYTKLIDPDALLIPYTAYDATYEYNYEPPALPKPRLIVSPALVEKGKPAGPPITGTPAAFFKVDIVIETVANASMLTLIQFAFKYKTDLFKLVQLPDGVNNATEGNFMNKTTWAPYGTDFFTSWGGVSAGKEKQYVLIAINPNDTSGNFDWGFFPDTTGLPVGERIICTFYFEATVQLESPWSQYVTGAFDIDYMFPALPTHMFLDANDEWIEGRAPVDGDYAIYGWVLGLMIDVYTQYPDDHNGKGLNETSDMFLPQGDVHLYAKLTYNGDPVQYKPVTFQVWNEAGYVNFTKTAMTDENGVAHIFFGIEWPCEGAEDLIFGVWTVVASASVREKFTWDWLWFKVYWLVYDFKVTADPTEVVKGTIATFIVTFVSFKEIPVEVLIHLVVLDNLQVPIGKASIWISVGDPALPWCENRSYSVNLSVLIPKWAFVGEGIVEVSALSNWPSEYGYAYCPEAELTNPPFIIVKYTP